ncbi:MAG: pentapeptide repeat-containing protein [Gammaproteobacteria bacterium]|nr:pentapeptide repeat-containing protein [Gammaproteobacteria bacterium]
MSVPQIKQNDQMYQLLRDEKVDEFNKRRTLGEDVNLTHCDFRSLDLRGLDAKGIDFTGSYFRQTDLRGINFSTSTLKECSLNGAKVSGTYFPKELTPSEIEMSLTRGTRMRYLYRE